MSVRRRRSGSMHTCVLVADDRDIYIALDRFTNYDADEPKPDSKWDYFGVGGCYEGFLVLKQPRSLRKFFGLLPAGETSRVSVATKAEIDQEALLAAPPDAIFFEDHLYECPLFAEGEALDEWRAEFRRRFYDIPPETTLQIVDAHS